MRKIIGIQLFIFFSFRVFSQEVFLPIDFRQHNFTQFNASLFNATYSLDWNNPRSLSIWSRWQWQTIDSDPTSLFVNYTHDFAENKALGGGFLQHNTGTYLNTGGMLNYAQSISISSKVNIALGANIFVSQQKLTDDRFTSNPGDEVMFDSESFIAQFSPGVRLSIDKFNVALSLENILDYNFTQSSSDSESKVFTSIISHDFNFNLISELNDSFIRPMVYVRTASNFDTQYGGNVLLSTSKFWIQGGYNNFYGVSGGLGGTFFNNFSLGALIEYGLDNTIGDENPTFELVASYHFGSSKQRNSDNLGEELKIVEENNGVVKNEEKTDNVLALEESEQRLAEEATLLRQQDSINEVRALEESIAKEKQRLDSIAKIEAVKKVVPLPNEKYEEVASTNIDGLQPGFYLIANVFGTKKYFEAFMKSLVSKGLKPKSFYRSKNNFNYVYLEKYETMEEARMARNSQFNGKYSGKTWIFRVKPD